MAANYRHIGGGENRLGRHYSRFSGIWPTSVLADQSLTLRNSQNPGSNRSSRARAREITAVLAESQFAPAAGGVIAAHSSVLVPCAGDRWLAVGDASMSFDPLAAQGLLHALFTGLCRGRNRGRLLAPPAKDQSAAARLRKQRVRLLQQFRQTADDAVGPDWGVWEQADSVAVVQNRVNAKPLRCRDLPFEATATIQV